MFVKEPFPDCPEDDKLDDIYSELVEYDSFVAGLVSSFLCGKRLNKKFLQNDDAINLKLKQHKDNLIQPDEDGVQQLIMYKQKLDNLMRMLKKINLTTNE
ncbi:hypothetical protein [Bacillus gaemokensis]|uniref:Transposase n=1 Tax=Bacillus gaemokensis TaxID=574375 RepID=A0A073KEE3_9BACI|nr:hypothetical protein [Bacillus gaemokensis]KEK24876.1 hypothetical protein BAGA_21595 [Bacillus gaemokensis]KYG30186.1 hypothetical protein AZF08_12605 [Bacillus gaemokensis]